MIHLDEEWLADQGLANLDARVKRELLRHVYRTFEMSLGTRLAEGMSEGQLREFEIALDQGDVQALEWMNANVPNHQQIAVEVFTELGQELRSRAPEILARFGQ